LEATRKQQFDTTAVLKEAETRCPLVDAASEPARFVAERYEEPKLWQLREQFRLDEVIAGTRSEFEQIVALGNWVADIIRSTAGRPPAPHEPKPPPFDAFYCLSLAPHYRLHCTHASIIFVQAATSLGFIARFTLTHHTAEFWSNEWGKWVFIDPKGSIAKGAGRGAIYFTHNGVPLSALEVRRFYYEGRWSELEVHPEDARIEGMPDYPDLFRRVAFLRRNNWFSEPYSPDYYDPNSPRHIFREAVWWTDEHTPPRLGCFNISQEHVFNFPVNFTQVALDYTDDLGVLQVTLYTFTPNFSHFLGRFNEGEWRRADHQFRWQLQPGDNALEVMAVNKFGRWGMPTRIVVHFDSQRCSRDDYRKIATGERVV
jgi:hypothetical protein